MELHQLRYAVQVAERRSFTRAAEDLSVAQPSLSQQIRKLEAELGFALFDRSPAYVRLTREGEHFLPYARAVLARLRDAGEAAAEIRGVQSGTLVLGVSPIAGAAVLPSLLRLVRDRFPRLTVQLREEGLSRLLELLRDGSADLTFVLLPLRERGLLWTTLLAEDLVVVLPAGHRLAGAASVEIDALRAEPFVLLTAEYGLRRQIEEECAAAGFAPAVAFESGQVDILQRLVEAGLGVTVLPASAVRGDLATAVRPLRAGGVTPQRRVGLAIRREHYVPLAAREVFALARTLDRRTSATVEAT